MSKRLVVLVALAGLVAALVPAATGAIALPQVVLSTSLTGPAEVPGPGDPDGRGFAIVKVDTRANEVCWWLFVSGIEPATAAHIHQATVGVAGPVVVGLAPPQVVGSGFVQLGFSRGCVSVADAIADAIAGNPHGYYVNVHNVPFPAGAVRGQL